MTNLNQKNIKDFFSREDSKKYYCQRLLALKNQFLPSACARRSIKGFTLVEVLVAIAVIAFTVPAVMLLMTKQTDYAGILRDKTIAMWIAQNELVALHNNRVYGGLLPDRETTDTVEMAGREWQVTMDIEKTDLGAKYIVKVGLDDKTVNTLETFLLKEPD